MIIWVPNAPTTHSVYRLNFNGAWQNFPFERTGDEALRLGWATNADFLAQEELQMQQGLTQTHNLRTNLGQQEIHVHFEVEWEAFAAVLGGGQQKIVLPSICTASPSNPATTSPAPASCFTQMAHTESNSGFKPGPTQTPVPSPSVGACAISSPASAIRANAGSSYVGSADPDPRTTNTDPSTPAPTAPEFPVSSWD